MPKIEEVNFQMRTIPDLETPREKKIVREPMKKQTPKVDKYYYANGQPK